VEGKGPLLEPIGGRILVITNEPEKAALLKESLGASGQQCEIVYTPWGPHLFEMIDHGGFHTVIAYTYDERSEVFFNILTRFFCYD